MAFPASASARSSVDAHVASSTSATGKKCGPRPVDRPRARRERFDVRERAGPEVAVVPPADREHRDLERVQAVDERPVAPERVERGMGAVRRELRVGVDHATAREVADVRPVVDLAALGRLDPAREHDVVVQRRRRLHRRDRHEVLGPLDRRAVAGLAPEALTEHPDPAIAERLRREPLDQVVCVAACLPEAAVVPVPAGTANTAQGRDDRVVATRSEEIGFTAVEVVQDDVRRELDHEPGKPAFDRHTVPRGPTELAGDRDSVSNGNVDRRPDHVVVSRTCVRPPFARVAGSTAAFCIIVTAADCYLRCRSEGPPRRVPSRRPARGSRFVGPTWRSSTTRTRMSHGSCSGRPVATR